MIAKKQILGLALASAFAAQARDPECRTFQVNLGPSANFARYEYECTPEVQGALVGLHFDAAHSRECREFVLLRFDGRWSVGEFEECGFEDTIRDYRTELDFGWNFNWTWCNRDMTFTPFVGVGFFYESNRFEAHESCSSFGCSSSCDSVCSSTGCSSCDDEIRYNNLFVPIGFNWVHHRNDCFSWGLTFEYRIDAWTRFKVSQDCCTVCDKVKPDKRTQGVMLEVPFMWKLNDGECYDWLLKFVPFFDWNRFGGGNCSCGCSTSCCTTSCCTSSCTSECCPNGTILDILENCDRELTDGCPIPQLKQWYIGAHLDVGVRF